MKKVPESNPKCKCISCVYHNQQKMNIMHFKTYGQLQTVIMLCQTDSHYEIKYITTVLAPLTFAQVQSIVGCIHHLSLVSGERDVTESPLLSGQRLRKRRGIIICASVKNL